LAQSVLLESGELVATETAQAVTAVPVGVCEVVALLGFIRKIEREDEGYRSLKIEVVVVTRSGANHEC
jgi:hypothetical protein